MSKKKVKKQTNYIMQDVMTWFTNVYVAVMLLVFPLFYQDKLYNILTAKRLFYYRWTSVFVFVGIIILIILQFEKHEGISLPKKIDPIPICCLLLCVASVVCVLTNDYPWKNFYEGGNRKFGEMLLVLGAISILLIGKHMKWNSNIIKCYLIGAGLVFLLEDLNAFMIDPLKMMENVEALYTKLTYVATLGNVNYATAFNSIMLPFSIFFYIKSEKIFDKGLYGVILLLGFAGLVACRSDSGMVAILVVLFLLFFLWVKDRTTLQSYLDIVILFLTGITIMIRLKKLFPERTLSLYDLSGVIGFFRTDIGIKVSVILLISCLLLRVVLVLYKGQKELKFKGIKIVVLLLLLVAGCGFFLMKGYSFRLDDSFGNYRGYIWKRSLMMYFQEYPFVNKLFGYGYYHVELLLDQYYGAEMMELLGAVFLEVHNEALQYLLSVGLVGVIGYLGVFAALLWKGFQNLKENRAMVFVIIEIVAILVQGLVNGPTVIITPLIFVNLGICYYVLCDGGDVFTQCSIETAGKHNK